MTSRDNRVFTEGCEVGLRTILAVALVFVSEAAVAQSTLATLSGAVYDQQRRVIPGAAITLTSLDTAQVRDVVSDASGRFWLSGLTPGRYEMRVALAGFETDISDVSLGLAADVVRDLSLSLAGISERATVTATVSPEEISRMVWGRTFDSNEIDGLPVAARDFTNLALLTPGILGSYSTSRGTDPGIVAAGQIVRNNTFALDGFSFDAHLGSLARGSVSLDAVREVMVSSNNFGAEYGHAAGAVVSVLTRSGTNDYSGRLFYFHRDDAWDATNGAARLTDPPAEKTKLQQQSVGGSAGGPIVRNRAFFFGSLEHTDRDSESIVTTPELRVFRPSAAAQLPVGFRNPQLFARSDFILTHRDRLSVRSRVDRRTLTNTAVERVPDGLVAPERRQDRSTSNDDVAATGDRLFASRTLNEFRVQIAHRTIDTDVDRYCGGCVTENRPGILLGKSDITPERSAERRWQLADTLTHALSGMWGEHTFKTGGDVSFLAIDGYQPAGFDGAFTFRVNVPFNPSDASTYPTLYRRNSGEPFYDLTSRVYAAFFQDEWRPMSRVTLNLGLRWDYEDAIGVTNDRDNLAPRLAAAWHVGDGRTSIRAAHGVYYDSVVFQALVNTIRGSQVSRLQIANPGYPDPFGPNPNRSGSAVNAAPNGRRFADRIRTPFTAQSSVGMSHQQSYFSMTADLVWATGHSLLRTRDANYPNLDDPRFARPDPRFQEILVREMEGRSSYRALEVGIRKRHSQLHVIAGVHAVAVPARYRGLGLPAARPTRLHR